MYAHTKAIVEQGHTAFRESVCGFRFGRARIPYPHELQHLPPFPQWLQERVERDVRAGIDVDEMLMFASLPSCHRRHCISFMLCIWLSLQSNN